MRHHNFIRGKAHILFIMSGEVPERKDIGVDDSVGDTAATTAHDEYVAAVKVHLSI